MYDTSTDCIIDALETVKTKLSQRGLTGAVQHISDAQARLKGLQIAVDISINKLIPEFANLTNSDCAAKIKRFRVQTGLTQTELATRLGVSFATINRWENSRTKPSPLAWRQLLQYTQDETIKGVT